MNVDAELVRIRRSIVDMQRGGGAYTGVPQNISDFHKVNAENPTGCGAGGSSFYKNAKEENNDCREHNQDYIHRNRIHPSQRVRPLYTLKRDYSTKDRPLLPTDTRTLYVLNDQEGKENHIHQGHKKTLAVR